MSESMLPPGYAYKRGPTVDTAPTGAAKCQATKKPILKGSLRIVSTESSRAFGEGKKYYTPKAFCAVNKKNGSTSIMSYRVAQANNQGRCKATGKLFQKGDFKLKISPP